MVGGVVEEAMREGKISGSNPVIYAKKCVTCDSSGACMHIGIYGPN